MALPFLKYFIPQDRLFFPLFDKAASNLQVGGKAIYSLVTCTTPEEKTKWFREIERIEHVGDEITHEIFSELSKNFITPYDREDIHRLVSAIDDVLDYIHGSSKRMELYKLDVMTNDIVKLSELIQTGTEELRRAIFELKNMRKMRDITDSLVRINSIENHADDIFDNAVARLFEQEKDAIQIIKIKEVLSALETATDKCEDAANVIESIIVKMA
jgi:predicted phosphate transport protein (TIGR00153 family)